LNDVPADPTYAEVLRQAIAEWLPQHPPPLLVALDGRSGTGKSLLAREMGALTGAAVIDGDDFYAGGSDTYWDAMSAADKVARVIDWRRQRLVLEALRQGRAATWRPYDWEADDGSPAGHELTCPSRAVVILDGAYSARPELADLLSLRVLLQVDRSVRRERLLQREGEHYRAQWEARWLVAEDLYFETIMPPAAFDLVLGSA
jgi:uridine kinase